MVHKTRTSENSWHIVLDNGERRIERTVVKFPAVYWVVEHFIEVSQGDDLGKVRATYRYRAGMDEVPDGEDVTEHILGTVTEEPAEQLGFEWDVSVQMFEENGWFAETQLGEGNDVSSPIGDASGVAEYIEDEE